MNYTVVHSNTELPYSEWKPAYVILGVWEGPTLMTPWVPYDLWLIARPEAERLVAYYKAQGKTSSLMIRTCRWRKDICEAVLTCIRASGYQAKVVYPPYIEDHCRQFTLTRR